MADSSPTRKRRAVASPLGFDPQQFVFQVEGVQDPVERCLRAAEMQQQASELTQAMIRIRSQAVRHLADQDGWSMAQIASAVGVPRATVQQMVGRARALAGLPRTRWAR